MISNLAQRIRDRAARRATSSTAESCEGGERAKGTQVPNARGSFARDAGLPSAQAKQMLRVANVPKELFEAMVEAPKPAKVRQLAEAGTKKQEKPRPRPCRDEWID